MRISSRFAGSILGLCAFIALPASAGKFDIDNPTMYQIIEPISADLLDADGGIIAEDIGKSIFDRSGLSTGSPLTSTHSTSVDSMWAAEIQGDEPMTLRFDLGEGYDIQEFWMWQYNDESETDRGLKSMDVIFRDEHGDIVGEITGATIEQANGDPVLPYYFCPIVQCIRFIEFRMLENYGDTNFIGFSEVLFAGRPKDAIVPEPEFHLVSLILSLLMFNRYRRRNR